ncbi:transposable element Tcb2 transposase [Trichonephila clavipes]|uniref:Transposable element Tcb2 transposase n=1 Tax=Trichonephila clavipes TaxID=2585209 RepID=A0A8X6T0W6_TRICX|nr:transposable element Tcb2 transposase [Trichonephila clavipes]
MLLSRFQRQYEQLPLFERGRIIGMMEYGWSARKASLRTPPTDQSSRRPPHRTAAPITYAVLDAHPSTSTLGVVLCTRKLGCSGMEPSCLFSDKSRFNLSSDDIHVRVWKPCGERLNHAFALHRHTAPTAYVKLPVAVLLQDNARPHIARVSQDCLHSVTSLPWPARLYICLQSSISGIIWDGILIGQRNGSLRGRVFDGRVACVVGDGSKERSAESGPRGRGTWLRMARHGGDSFISRNSPWLRTWTVPGSTL